jgi:hypothetical protein
MDKTMSQRTRKEVLNKLRRRYATAGREHKRQLLNEAQALLGYHRKAAIRALGGVAPVATPFVRTGRPVVFAASALLPWLQPIWAATDYACGRRLVAMLPEWVPAYEAHVRPMPTDVRERLLLASGRTLDRLLAPLRGLPRGRCLTRPGTLLRQQIPIRGSVWEDGKAGWLEVDTVALCGGSVAEDFVWMVDAVDHATTWVELRAIWGRGQVATLAALQDMEANLPFPLLGLDSDNGGEFINYHVLRWLQQRKRPVFMTRSRPYKKDDNAHVEQKNWTHVRQCFGYERHDNPEVVALINTLAKGAYGQLRNYFHASLKLESKETIGGRLRRHYGPAQTPLKRVLASAQVSAATKTRLTAEKAGLNPLVLQAEVARSLKAIAALRRACL